MKLGNRVYCKESYITSSVHAGTEEWVTKGKCYDVVYNNEDDIYSIVDNDGDFNNTLTGDYLFNKHFYTEQKYRKLKLQKLYDTERR